MKSAIVETAPACIAYEFLPLPLPQPTFLHLRAAVFAAVAACTARDPKITTVGISTSGAVDSAGRVPRSGAIEGYADIDWGSLIRPHFLRISHVIVVNDGRAGTWAEYQRRGGTGSLAHLVVGTGVGGGIALAGTLLAGAHNAAGGFGHISVDPGSRVECSCTRTGCVETLAAAPAVVRRYHQLRHLTPSRHATPARRAAVARRAEAPPAAGTLTARDVAHAARGGDVTAGQAFRDAGSWLGIAMGAVITMFDPDVITVGGGLLAAAAVAAGTPQNGYFDAAERAARAHVVRRVADQTVIAPAAYGANSNLIGAALMAADPDLAAGAHA